MNKIFTFAIMCLMVFGLHACPECNGTCGGNQCGDGFIDLWVNAGEQMRNDHPEKALELMSKAIEIANHKEDADVSFLLLSRSDIYVNVRDYVKAIADLQQVIEYKREHYDRDGQYITALLKMFNIESMISSEIDLDKYDDLALRSDPWVLVATDGDYWVMKTQEGLDEPESTVFLVDKFIDYGIIESEDDVFFMGNCTVLLKTRGQGPIFDHMRKMNEYYKVQNPERFSRDMEKIQKTASLYENFACPTQWPANQNIIKAIKYAHSVQDCKKWCGIIHAGLMYSMTNVPGIFGKFVVGATLYASLEKCNECCVKGFNNCFNEFIQYVPQIDWWCYEWETEDMCWWDGKGCKSGD